MNQNTISTDYTLHVEPTDNAKISALARRWNITEAATLAKLLILALDRFDLRDGAETATYTAEIERVAELLKTKNAVTRRTYAVAV